MDLSSGLELNLHLVQYYISQNNINFSFKINKYKVIYAFKN
jgi:hypothetical protein